MRMPLCNRLTRSRTLDITFLIIDKLHEKSPQQKSDLTLSVPHVPSIVGRDNEIIASETVA